jgi:hypothetical protein
LPLQQHGRDLGQHYRANHEAGGGADPQAAAEHEGEEGRGGQSRPIAERRQCPAGLQRFEPGDLHQRSGQHAVARHREDIAQLDGARSDHHLPIGDALRLHLAGQQVAGRDAVDVSEFDPVVDQDLARWRRLAVKRHRERRDADLAGAGLRGKAIDQAIAPCQHIDRHRRGMRCKAVDRQVQPRRPGGAVDLLECREIGIAAGRLERCRQRRVAFRAGTRGKIDVERHFGGAERHQPVEQFGMHLARPGPYADLRQAGTVDIDEHHLATGRAAAQLKPDILGQSIERAEGAELSGSEHRCDNQDREAKPRQCRQLPSRPAPSSEKR